MQLVSGSVSAGSDELYLGLPLCFAQRKGLTVLPAEDMTKEGSVDDSIAVGIHSAGGTEEGHSTAIGIKHGSLTQCGGRMIERQNVA